MNCLQCGKDTDNPKFCSKSCSVSYFNKRKPKRLSTRTKICPICGEPKGDQSKTCRNCNTNARWELARRAKIKDYFRDKSPSRAKYTDIRKWARKFIKESGREEKCEICGFDVYVEVCHRKSISSFSGDSLLDEVNSLDNLIYLCPNHHVMFDKGLINI